jgi:AraC-like DNA-binding protein
VLLVDPLARELIIACAQGDDAGTPQHQRRLTVLFDSLQPDLGRPLWIPTPTDPRLQRVCELIDHNLAAPMTLRLLAKHVGLSERTLSRLFTQEFSMTYPQWRTQLRLHHALRLLAEDHSVTDVAYRCGWATPSAFIDVFKRALGHTPAHLSVMAPHALALPSE